MKLKRTQLFLASMLSLAGIFPVYLYTNRPPDLPHYTLENKEMLTQPSTAKHLRQLSEYWAPIIYQQTHPRQPAADFMTRFDFDGDFDSTNNWENMEKFPLKAYIYNQVSESATHWFLYYGIFHPRDWEPLIDNPFSSHENDLESILLVIRKDGTENGHLQLMETHAHQDFQAYTNEPLQSASLQVSGPLVTEQHRPKIFIPTGGHGNYGFQSDQLQEHGIVYHFGSQAQEPISRPGAYVDSYSYQLLPIDALWKRREQIGQGLPYGSFGEFGANDFTWVNGADAPWFHDDWNDGLVIRGDIFTDPAYMIDTHFDNLRPFSHHYLTPARHTHRIKLTAIEVSQPSDSIFIEIWAQDQPIWGKHHWIQSHAEPGVSYPLPELERFLNLPQDTEIKLVVRSGQQSLGSFKIRGQKQLKRQSTDTGQAYLSADIQTPQ